MKSTRGMPVAAVRLPEDLMKWFRHQAVENNRSLGAELAERLLRSQEQQVSRVKPHVQPRSGAEV